MTKFVVVGLAVILTSSIQALQAMPVGAGQGPHKADTAVVKVREACGAGMHRVNGVCIRTHARRAASRCARGVTC
jgi:hypothetical protein